MSAISMSEGKEEGKDGKREGKYDRVRIAGEKLAQHRNRTIDFGVARKRHVKANERKPSESLHP